MKTLKVFFSLPVFPFIYMAREFPCAILIYTGIVIGLTIAFPCPYATVLMWTLIGMSVVSFISVARDWISDILFRLK